MKQTWFGLAVVVITIALLTGCLTGIDPSSYQVGGTVTHVGDAVEGVEILVNNQTAAVTDVQGSWSATVSGTVTISAKKGTYTFLPESTSIEAQSSEVDFSTVVAQTEGMITLRLRKAQPVEAASETDSLPDPSHIRLVIRNSQTNYKLIRDVAVPYADEFVELRVPAAEGYRVDAISYLENGYHGYHLLLKHDSVHDVLVYAGQPTEVRMILQPFAYEVELPDSVVKGTQYTITVQGVPDVLHSYIQIAADATQWNTNAFGRHGMSVSNDSNRPYTRMGTRDFHAPDADQLYIQFNARLDSALVIEGKENNWNWVFWNPDLDRGGSLYTVPLVDPADELIIDIEY